MKHLSLLLACFPFFLSASEDAWESKRIIADFYSEGASIGDIDGDGKVDIAYGPFWVAGPDFDNPVRFAEGEPFVAEKGYSDNFFNYITDVNGDGENDILIYGFPGKEARVYINPGAEKRSENWVMHIIANEISNESPTFVDLIPGGSPEIVCTANTSYGYYAKGADGTKPWTWHAISPEKEAGGRFEHGLGVGDVNGDGRLDIIQRQFWYEQPEQAGDGHWKKHGWAPLAIAGGAQILVDDVDGDGDKDLISSLKAHGFGLAWFEQTEPGKFSRHDLMGEKSTDNPFGVCFSQLHALTLADIDQDGRNDFVTGKRYLAHQGKDPGGLEEPVLYWWRNTKTENGIEFVPHLVHRDSGVGVEINTADLNGDGKLDIISGNKKGLTIHLQKADTPSQAERRWQNPEGKSQDDYGSQLSPEEALKRMEVPDGFSIDLIAAEPDITQPIAMCFDARGRIWVIEGHTYPVPAPEGEKGKDRILILEDTDQDGSFETRKVFAENINLASGIEVGFGGVYVGAAPYLLFYPDKNADDKPDGEPEILLDGWGHQDTHETLNAFTWGPDGWLYGCHGIFTHSKVGKPGTPDDLRTPLNAGVWRFHPVRKEFEVFAHGTSNPWGLDFNGYGDWFVSACVIPHFFHLNQGGRYERQAGQHFNPYTFTDIKTIADHAHYAGNIRDHAFWGENRESRPSAPVDTSSLGGGHAHCGLAIYQADEFPLTYRNSAFFHNLHGHRVLEEKLEHNGSGYLARHRPDFMLANNHDHIGVGIMQGPDGAIYISDWVDPQTCHHRDVEIWDRSNGRIFRIRHGELKSPATQLTQQSDVELVASLGNGNAFIARQARRLLQERGANKIIDHEAVDKALAAFDREHTDRPALLLRSLWTRHVCELHTPESFIAAFNSEHEHLRAWAVQLFGDAKEALPDQGLKILEDLASNDSSLVVRRYLASRLQRLPVHQRWKIAEGLITHSRSIHDPNIPLLCWYGIEPLIDVDAGKALELMNKTPWPELKDFITRRAATNADGRSAMMSSLSTTNNPDEYLKRAKQLLTALDSLPPVEKPEGWEAAREKGNKLASKKPEVANVLSRLGTRFGDSSFFPHWRGIVRNEKLAPPRRIEAMEILTLGNDPELGKMAREALDTPPLRAAAIQALRKHPAPETATAIVDRIDQFPVKLRNEAINFLSTREDMALILLEAVDRKKVPSSLVSTVMLDQFGRYKNEKIDEIIQANWTMGSGGVDIARLTTAVDGWKKKLSPQILAKADASKGRQTFQATCGTCHQLFGQGIALGPDLTGSNRADLGYLLENVLSPSAVVGKDYLLNIFTMKDGSVISGMIKKETPDFVSVSMPGGTLTEIKTADIVKREELAQSLMPAGLFEALPLPQVANLVKYLSAPNQVPLPGEKKSPPVKSQVPPPAKGVTRIEGESFAEKFKPTGGQIREQAMSGFGSGWSENSHLWWTGGRPGDVLTLKLPSVPSGTKKVTLFPTTARDYATIKVSINGQLRESDLYTEEVLPGTPLLFEKVNVSPGEPLQIDIHITGANDAAVPRYMVGVDRIEVE